MSHTHTPAEWASVLSHSALASVPVLTLLKLALDTDRMPRPDVRGLAVRAGDRVLVETVNARYAARDALVALAILLAPTSAPQKGALR